MIVSREKLHGKDKKSMLSYIIGFFVGVVSLFAGMLLYDKRKSTDSVGDFSDRIEKNRERAVSNHTRAERTAQTALDTISEVRKTKKNMEDNNIRESWDNCELFDNGGNK